MALLILFIHSTSAKVPVFIKGLESELSWASALQSTSTGRTLTSVGEDSGTGCTSGANGEAAKSTPNSAKVYSVCGTLLRNACDGINKPSGRTKPCSRASCEPTLLSRRT